MTQQIQPARAPRAFLTHRGAARWADTHNPFEPGDPMFHPWRSAYWHDQADRAWARARVLFALSILCGIVSVTMIAVRVLG